MTAAQKASIAHKTTCFYDPLCSTCKHLALLHSAGLLRWYFPALCHHAPSVCLAHTGVYTTNEKGENENTPSTSHRCTTTKDKADIQRVRTYEKELLQLTPNRPNHFSSALTHRSSDVPQAMFTPWKN